MIVNLNDLLRQVQSVPYGSPAHQLAELVCLLRGQHPDDWVPVMHGMTMERWRVVLLEERAMKTLDTEMGM